MAAIASFLPAPSRKVSDPGRRPAAVSKQVISVGSIPPYGHRQHHLPRTLADFGDGGAFPEIAMAQFPLNMGREKTTSNALAVQLDAEGNIKYGALARLGKRDDQVVFSKFSDLLPKNLDNEPGLDRPDDETVAELTDKTRDALDKLVESKIAAAMPVKCAEQAGPAQFIRYTPSQQGVNYGAKQREIRMVEAQKDPMEPCRFKMNMKLPRPPPSPPAPVMHSPPRKLTPKEQQDWKVPPCISSWKNHKGYTIPLDKRLAADGRGLQTVHINENFNKLAEALYVADRKAREAVETRALVERKIASKAKEQKEQELRVVAKYARDQRVGIKATAPAGGMDEEEKEREEFRREQEKRRARERNISRAAPDKRNRLERERERDISETIALNLPNPNKSRGGADDFDQRLFNQSQGMDSGFGAEDNYNVYDKAWRSEKEIGSSIYRPSKNIDKDTYGGDLDQIIKTNRFVADKGFSGVDKETRRDGPVQFEKDDERDDDPFGVSEFLKETKETKFSQKRESQSSSSRHDEKRRR